MSNSVYDILKERGLIAQTTHDEEIRKILANEKVTFYIGFDPTADSLHIGHFLQMVVMAHMQKAGHKPIAIIGGGTAIVGDPSGRSDMRQMMTMETIDHNANMFKKQLSTLVDFSAGNALMVNNADWLLGLNYVQFIREIGVHFSVNRMLSAECFKSRLEKGLSFLEFNYMLMQSYDFLELNRRYGCTMQLGGDDQWSNILGGIELIRRVEGKESYGMTFTLLTTSEGKKMGKTQSGAVWLDRNKTSPYEFYQYWRNIADSDVINCLKLLTFIPMETINELAKLEGKDLNEAKRLLALEVTTMVHGREDADASAIAAEALFGEGSNMDNVPTTIVTDDVLGEGLAILEALVLTGLVPSKGEGRRVIEQGGLTINGEKVQEMTYIISKESLANEGILIKKGKKTYHRVKMCS